MTIHSIKALRMDQHSFKIAIKYRGRHKKV
jgi:hypothetical protein